jgi:hypothetical protein
MFFEFKTLQCMVVEYSLDLCCNDDNDGDLGRIELNDANFVWMKKNVMGVIY